MDILDYGPNAVCFKDYEVNDRKVFLEASFEEKYSRIVVNFIPKYSCDDNVNFSFSYDGDWRLRSFTAGGIHSGTLDELQRKVDDLATIMKDVKVMGEIARKIGLLDRRVDETLKEILEGSDIDHDESSFNVMYDVGTVGVMGDQRTYSHPVEIGVFKDGKPVCDYDFMAELSNRITNTIKGINRVVYTVSEKK